MNGIWRVFIGIFIGMSSICASKIPGPFMAVTGETSEVFDLGGVEDAIFGHLVKGWLLDQAATIESYCGIWWDFNGFESWVDDSWCAPNYSNLCFKLSGTPRWHKFPRTHNGIVYYQNSSALLMFITFYRRAINSGHCLQHLPPCSHFIPFSHGLLVEFFTNLPISK